MEIRVLDERTIDKIAAGEVVEKVSSVIKELVENSIDAGSSNIKIELINAGIKEMRVTDDGKGMDSIDAVLAFTPHATSKIKNENDLYFINTLGFRGEALASIASVAQVELFTKTLLEENGTHIESISGRPISSNLRQMLTRWQNRPWKKLQMQRTRWPSPRMPLNH